ncbi:MAG: hypothetical protein CMJ35_09290 [Phycisphaerae bacterium]|nr:hypothetical protein [Phycisphaerae bacterium]MBM91789.1 hypothetical protein [Phycisphaerae bacterium]HCT44860.1 hypothetical protein [Phycisphaerales bacterium]
MKHLVALSIAILFVAIAFAITRPSTPAPAPTDHRVVYIVRHAEKLDGQDPDLSEAGLTRADMLAHTLGQEDLGAIFVTDTNRSRQTAAPTALAHEIKPTQYPATDAQALRAMLDALPANTNALVIAHSNTVSSIIEALGGQPIGDLPDDEYTRLYALVLSDAQLTRTLQLSY